MKNILGTILSLAIFYVGQFLLIKLVLWIFSIGFVYKIVFSFPIVTIAVFFIAFMSVYGTVYSISFSVLLAMANKLYPIIIHTISVCLLMVLFSIQGIMLGSSYPAIYIIIYLIMFIWAITSCSKVFKVYAEMKYERQNARIKHLENQLEDLSQEVEDTIEFK